MRLSRFFIDQTFSDGQSILLSKKHSHYMRNVLRLKIGDSLTVFNGQGGEFEALIVSMDRNTTSLKLGQFTPLNRQSKLKIALGLALIKRDAMDAAIQKATELGVHSIHPLICSNSVVSQKNLDKRLNHWQEICYSACEQCGLNIPPILSPHLNFIDWIEQDADLRIIGSPKGSLSISEIESKPESVMIAIGPEGGFSEEEINLANNKGFKELSLGNRILRADTAVTAISTLVQSSWGDL